MMDSNLSPSIYQVFFENSPGPSFMLGPDFLILDANRAARLLYGYENHEFIGKELFSLVDSRDLPFGETSREALAKGQSKIRLTGRRKDGRWFPGIFSIEPLGTEIGKGYLCTILVEGVGPPDSSIWGDMSEDLLPNRQLDNPGEEDQRNILKLTRIFDNLSEVVYMYEVSNNDTYRFESVNSAFLNVTGLRKNQVVGRYVEEVIPEPSLTLVRSKYARAIELRQTVQWEEVTPYPSGVKTGLVSVTPLYDEHRTCTHLLGTVIDITEVRAAERDLQRSNERYEYATKATREAIYDWDLVTGQIHRGEGFSKLFYLDTLHVSNDPDIWDAHLHPDEKEAVHCSLKSFLADGTKEQWECEYRFRRRDGSYSYVEDRAFAIRDKAGKPLRLVGAMQDLTTRKEHEAERELLISHLTKRNTELEQFSFITSHHLRAPLSNLLGLLDLLKPDPATSQSNHLILQKIRKSSQQLNSIVEDLSEILLVKSTPNSGAVQVSLEETFHQVSQEARDLLAAASATVETDFSQGSIIFFSKAYLRNILSNLLSNSVKFRSPKRALVIQVRTQVVHGRLTLTFTDNGIGIDLNRHGGKMFLYQRFQAKEGSNGIGLFMVQEQLRAMGGSIMVTSQVNVGTTFTLFFN